VLFNNFIYILKKLTICNLSESINCDSGCSKLLNQSIISATRETTTGATYPHINFSVPMSLLWPAVQNYIQSGGVG